MSGEDFHRIPVWYPHLAGHTFLTSFLKLRKDALKALANGEETGPRGTPVWETIRDLRNVLEQMPGNAFVCTDVCAPTDTTRFFEKNGAVYSAESAWRFLAQSTKVRLAAQAGQVEYLCIRPFRRMTQAREFRLFVRDGKLSAMSQYHLVRHFRRLEGVKAAYWDMARELIKDIGWLIPLKEFVMDVYFTAEDRIMILDINPWGPPTDPLLLRTWDRDWDQPAGIVLMPPPVELSGEVNVSF